MLDVCLASFYLSFLLVIAIKDTLVFYAIRKGGAQEGRYEHILMLMIIFDLVVLMTLPLLIMATKGVC